MASHHSGTRISWKRSGTGLQRAQCMTVPQSDPGYLTCSLKCAHAGSIKLATQSSGRVRSYLTLATRTPVADACPCKRHRCPRLASSRAALCRIELAAARRPLLRADAAGKYVQSRYKPSTKFKCERQVVFLLEQLPSLQLALVLLAVSAHAPRSVTELGMAGLGIWSLY